VSVLRSDGHETSKERETKTTSALGRKRSPQ
jgi:hypothetical protein